MGMVIDKGFAHKLAEEVLKDYSNNEQWISERNFKQTKVSCEWPIFWYRRKNERISEFGRCLCWLLWWDDYSESLGDFDE